MKIRAFTTGEFLYLIGVFTFCTLLLVHPILDERVLRPALALLWIKFQELDALYTRQTFTSFLSMLGEITNSFAPQPLAFL